MSIDWRDLYAFRWHTTVHARHYTHALSHSQWHYIYIHATHIHKSDISNHTLKYGVQTQSHERVLCVYRIRDRPCGGKRWAAHYCFRDFQHTGACEHIPSSLVHEQSSIGDTRRDFFSSPAALANRTAFTDYSPVI